MEVPAKTVLFALLATMSIRTVALAQDLPTFAGGSVMFSSQASPAFGNRGPSYPPSGVGGTAIGVTGAIGRFLTPGISIAFEPSVPSRFESVKEINYDTSYQIDNRHRDLILSGLVGFALHQSGKVHLTLVGGPSIVREDTLQRTAFRLVPVFTFQGDFGPYGAETQLTRWTMGIAYGVDVAVDVSRHVSIVTDARMYWISRAVHEDSQSERLGLSSFVIRPALGIRARF
jgi:hypothetical protein